MWKWNHFRISRRIRENKLKTNKKPTYKNKRIRSMFLLKVFFCRTYLNIKATFVQLFIRVQLTLNFVAVLPVFHRRCIVARRTLNSLLTKEDLFYFQIFIPLCLRTQINELRWELTNLEIIFILSVNYMKQDFISWVTSRKRNSVTLTLNINNLIKILRHCSSAEIWWELLLLVGWAVIDGDGKDDRKLTEEQP